MKIWLIQNLAAFWRSSRSEQDIAEVWGPANCRLWATDARNGWRSAEAGRGIYWRSARCMPAICLTGDGTLLARADTLSLLDGLARAAEAVDEHRWVDCPIAAVDIVRGPRPAIAPERHYMEYLPRVEEPQGVSYRTLLVPQAASPRSRKRVMEFASLGGGCKRLELDPESLRRQPLAESPGNGFLVSDAAPAAVVDWFLTENVIIAGTLTVR